MSEWIMVAILESENFARPPVVNITAGKVRFSKMYRHDSTATVDLPVAKTIASSRVVLEKCLEIVSREHNISIEDLIGKFHGKGRGKNRRHARKIIMYLMRTLTELSLVEIGRFMECHHATVLYGFRNISSRMRTDEDLRREVLRLNQQIRKVCNMPLLTENFEKDAPKAVAPLTPLASKCLENEAIRHLSVGFRFAELKEAT